MRGLASKQKTGRESSQTRSLVADSSGGTAGPADVKTSGKKPTEEERPKESPAERPRTKTRPKAERQPEASNELSANLCAPPWNPPREGVLLVESCHQPEEVPVESIQEPGGSRHHLSRRRKFKLLAV